MATDDLFHDPDATLDAVEAVARVGAHELMRHWRALDPSQIDEKAANDLVSAADRAAEDAILGAIRSRFPDHGILSEEAGLDRGSDHAVTWIVDPLDGTTNFVAGMAHFAVSVALAEAGEPVFGVVLDPIKGDLFRAASGRGAWWNGRRCRIGERPGLSGALLATGFPFKAHRLLDPYLAIFRDVFLRCRAVRRTGSAALDLAYTAAGIFDGFFEFKLSTWDLAAGAVLVRESGGVITDMDGGPAHLGSGNVVCGPEGLHRELLGVIQEHRGAWLAAGG